ncbi:MAG: NADH-quinone oxidoreductase subunit L [Deltaproteobacteria bacterium]|nr:NADH-quinone oxidoreductase subunit L [Deltaproteobacteria bacterium]
MNYTADTFWPLAIILALPLVGAILNGFLLDWIGMVLGERARKALTSRPVVHGVAIAAVGVSFLIAALSIFGALMAFAKTGHHGEHAEAPFFVMTMWKWIQVGGVDLDAKLLLDPLSSVMILVVTGVSSIIHIYSTGYMAHDPAYRRFFTYLNLFVFFMNCLVLGDNLAVMFVGWEGVGLCSYLLIGFWYDDRAKALAGKKAFITNRVGDFGFILGMFLIGTLTGHLDFAGIKENLGALTGAGEISILGIVSISTITLTCLLLFLGATGKSAQIPLFVWLPDAMAGPTPVSALIHAATMVTAGVYMVARLNFLFLASPPAMTVVAIVGAVTAITAALIGFAQNDIKKVLAYSTVSQLGYMFLAVGVGAYTVAIFHLMTHAFFKACLFLGSGSVIHGMHARQDIREMGGLRKKMPHTHWTFAVSVAAISGLPLLSGFFSKDEILWRAFANGNDYAPWAPNLVYTVGLITAAMTAFYMGRVYFMTFWGKFRGPAELWDKVHESPYSMTVPLMVLAGLAVVGGYIGTPAWFPLPNWFEHWLHPVLSEVHVREAMHHNLTMEFGLMGASIALAFCGLFLGYYLYGNGPHPLVGKVTGAVPWLYKWVAGKLWVDELYGLFIYRPLGWFAALCHRVGDRFLIDKIMVEGSGWLASSGGWMASKLHGGRVQRYVGAMALGMAVILYFVATPRTEVEIEHQGNNTVRFVAPYKDAPYSYSWDFDGDSLEAKGDERWARYEQVWTTSSSVQHRYPGPGTYQVVMRVRTPWKFERKRVIEVQVGGPGEED